MDNNHLPITTSIQHRKYHKHPIKIWMRRIVGCYPVIIVGCICLMVGYLIKPAQVILRSSSVPLTVDIPFHVNLGEGYTTRPLAKITITSYTNRVEETDNTPDVTATDDSVAEGIIAISQDLWKRKVYPGDFIWVPKLGKWFIARDTMNKRLTRRMDIFTYSKKVAGSFKIETDVFVVHAVR